MNISTSLICTDLSDIKSDIDVIVEHEGFNWLHADFMDGHFVPRYGISPELIKSLRARYGKKIIIDSHLMVQDPYTYADVIAPYSDWFFFHYEAVTDPVRTLQMLRKKYPDLKIGLVFNVFTPDILIEDILQYNEGLLDGVMFMGISPGVLGTSSFPQTVIRRLNTVSMSYPEIKTFVDGSVNFETVKLYKDCGAHTVVSGSSMIFKPNRGANDMKILSRAEQVAYNIEKIKMTLDE